MSQSFLQDFVLGQILGQNMSIKSHPWRTDGLSHEGVADGLDEAEVLRVRLRLLPLLDVVDGFDDLRRLHELMVRS